MAVVRRGLRRRSARRGCRPGRTPAGRARSIAARNGRLITGLPRPHAEQDDQDPAADPVAGLGHVGEQPGEHQRGPGRRASRRRAPAGGAAADSGRAMSSRSAWTGAIRAVRRAGSQAAAMVTTDADDVAPPRTVRGAKTSGCPDRSRPNVREQRADAHAPAAPRAPRPSVEPTSAEHERLEQHRPGDLPLGGAQGPQQRELAAALGDQDREGVDDEEAPTTSAMPAKISRKVVRKQIASSRSLARLVGGLVAGDRLVAGGQQRGDLVAQLGLGDAVLGGHPDVGEGVLAARGTGPARWRCRRRRGWRR